MTTHGGTKYHTCTHHLEPVQVLGFQSKTGTRSATNTVKNGGRTVRHNNVLAFRLLYTEAVRLSAKQRTLSNFRGQQWNMFFMHATSTRYSSTWNMCISEFRIFLSNPKKPYWMCQFVYPLCRINKTYQLGFKVLAAFSFAWTSLRSSAVTEILS